MPCSNQQNMACHRGQEASLWAMALPLIAASVVEIALLTWLALAPLWHVLPQTFPEWVHTYSPGNSNADVWAATILRTGVIFGLVGAAPSRRASRYGDAASLSHKQLALAIGVACSLFEVGLLLKACAVAITAPERAWPQPQLTHPFVGLVYMFTSLGVAMVGSLAQAVLAKRVISHARELHHAPAEQDSLEAPLLQQQKGTADGAHTSAAQDTGTTGNGTAGGSTSNGKKGDAEKDKKSKGKISSKTVGALLRLSYPDWPIIVVAFLFGTLAALAQACIPYYTGRVIDYASIDPDRVKFKRTVLLLVAVSGVCGVFAGCRGGLFTVGMVKLNMRIRKKLFRSLLMQEIGFFDVTKTGEIISRLSTDTSTVSDQVCLNLNVMLRSLTQAAMVLVFMFTASWRLTVVTFVVVPGVMTISKIYGHYFSALAKKVQGEIAEANAVAEEVISSMTTVKAHAAEDSAEAAYHEKLSKYFVLLVKEAIIYTAYMAANTFLPNSVTALVLWYGGQLVLNNEMSPGALISFMFYQQSLSGAFQSLGDVFSGLMTALGAADKVLDLMARQPQVDPGGSLVPTSFSGHIQLRDVHFFYPARPTQQVLKGLSMEVTPGQVVALVGPSGGGKSSIVKLLERFYVPQSGSVLLDGLDIGVYDRKWLRRRVALVSQEPVLYSRSVRRNIIYGIEEEDGVTPPTQEEIEMAAREANAHDFILGFPDQYETNCGEKGVTLSGGQKQRLAIARALVRRPSVLLLDEATSALDADSEAVVQEALDRVMSGRTVLVIAHRLSTVVGADKIIVIGNGQVQEVGNHESLLAQQGVYASLVRRQLKGGASAASLTHLAGQAGSGSVLGHGGK